MRQPTKDALCMACIFALFLATLWWTVKHAPRADPPKGFYYQTIPNG